jgi:hypothetical protein
MIALTAFRKTGRITVVSIFMSAGFKYIFIYFSETKTCKIIENHKRLHMKYRFVLIQRNTLLKGTVSRGLGFFNRYTYEEHRLEIHS